ncbi:hypothetical protein FMN63_16830 [Stappia sp. BW2]|uniref:hypothetical protein n=1 Tax=Stappia sp. BW2 TaxID=2592622 RepID=UPI0011DE6E82|nr:hypothetical protein [Stappia sp. BW2]TYC67714.1 hypothetical protein FMN63_16830 [Stappia sp. BW2]
MHAAEQTAFRAPRGTSPDAKTDQPAKEHSAPDAPLSVATGEAAARTAAPVRITCEEQIQAALIDTLNSPEFQSAPQLRAFLGFVVHATLNRQQEKIKGYTIAVEALGRPEDFNPVTDPIVRVEAARLRRRLEKYYAGSGADVAVRITIPKGSYAPEFHSAKGKELPDCSADLSTKDKADSDPAGRHPALEAMAQQHLETGDAPGASEGYYASQPTAPPFQAEAHARNRTTASGLYRKLQGGLANPVAPRLVFALCLASFLAGYLAGKL